MATQADLELLKKAALSGRLSIQDADGKRVEYRSMRDMMAAIRALELELGITRPGSDGWRYDVVRFDKGIR